MTNGNLLGQIANPNVPSFTQSFGAAQPIFQGIRQAEEQGQAKALQGEIGDITARLQEAQIAGTAPGRADVERIGRIAFPTLFELAHKYKFKCLLALIQFFHGCKLAYSIALSNFFCRKSRQNNAA